MPNTSSSKPPSSSVRIIAGEWRGRRLNVMNKPGLRPTTGRIRETLFNWLMSDIRNARCLDVFAGTGALGFESLSRGASFVQFCESDKDVARALSRNLETLLAPEELVKRARVASIQSSALIRNWSENPFDIIFLDPPFSENGLLETTLLALHSAQLLKDNGLVYIEQDRFSPPFTDSSLLAMNEEGVLSAQDDLRTHFKQYRSQTSGKVRYGLYSYHCG